MARWPAGHISRRLRGTVAGGSYKTTVTWHGGRRVERSLGLSTDIERVFERERACVFKFGNMRDG